MKINKLHFTAMEDSFNEHLMESLAAGINSNNYGLLPPLPGKNSSLKTIISIDNESKIHVKILECRAITPGGARIEILENDGDVAGFSLPFPQIDQEVNSAVDSTYYILLSIKPFSRIPVGNADPSEEPPRYPYTMPEIKAHILPEDQMTSKELGPFHLTVGKFRMIDGQPEAQSDFIPPCTTILSHEKLKELHLSYEKFLGDMEIHLLKILRKIREKEQSNELANSVADLSTNLLNFVGMSITAFKWTIQHQPPIAMFEVLARCARIIKNNLDINMASSREELLNYFTDWCNLKQGEFEEILNNSVSLRYEHTRISDTVKVVDQFVHMISTLFEKLCDLDYIGKKKDTGIFVKEQKASSSFLAD